MAATTEEVDRVQLAQAARGLVGAVQDMLHHMLKEPLDRSKGVYELEVRIGRLMESRSETGRMSFVPGVTPNMLVHAMETFRDVAVRSDTWSAVSPLTMQRDFLYALPGTGETVRTTRAYPLTTAQLTAAIAASGMDDTAFDGLRYDAPPPDVGGTAASGGAGGARGASGARKGKGNDRRGKEHKGGKGGGGKGEKKGRVAVKRDATGAAKSGRLSKADADLHAETSRRFREALPPPPPPVHIVKSKVAVRDVLLPLDVEFMDGLAARVCLSVERQVDPADLPASVPAHHLKSVRSKMRESFAQHGVWETSCTFVWTGSTLCQSDAAMQEPPRHELELEILDVEQGLARYGSPFRFAQAMALRAVNLVGSEGLELEGLVRVLEDRHVVPAPLPPRVRRGRRKRDAAAAGSMGPSGLGSAYTLHTTDTRLTDARVQETGEVVPDAESLAKEAKQRAVEKSTDPYGFKTM